MLLSGTWTHQRNVHEDALCWCTRQQNFVFGKPFPSPSLSYVQLNLQVYSSLYFYSSVWDVTLQCVSAPLPLLLHMLMLLCVCACVMMRGVYNQETLCECVWCGCDSWLLSFLCLFVSPCGRRSFLIIFVVPAEGAVFSIGKRISANEPDKTRRGARTDRRSAQLKLTW